MSDLAWLALGVLALLGALGVWCVLMAAACAVDRDLELQVRQEQHKRLLERMRDCGALYHAPERNELPPLLTPRRSARRRGGRGDANSGGA